MRSLTVHRESIESRAAYELITALNAELSHLYPEPGANHFHLDVDEVAPGRGAFLIARSERVPVGCGAVRRLDTDTAEIKRMYVLPKFRGQGVGREVLKRLEAIARELGAKRIVLETGERQPAAVAMYRSHGFEPIPRYGEYIDDELSFCMGKVLAAR